MTYKRHEEIEIGRGFNREIVRGPDAIPGDRWTLRSSGGASWTVEILSQSMDRYGQWTYTARFPSGQVRTVPQFDLNTRFRLD